jgi:hypothetical protein
LLPITCKRTDPKLSLLFARCSFVRYFTPLCGLKERILTGVDIILKQDLQNVGKIGGFYEVMAVR